MKRPEDLIELEGDEAIVKVVGHHVATIAAPLVISFMILMLDFFLMTYFFAKGLVGLLVFFLVLLIVVLYAWRIWFLWQRNLVVLTTKRLIDYERSGFFDQLISAFPYHKIKQVQIKKKGLWQTMFKYGDIYLKIQDQSLTFELYSLKSPDVIGAMINERASRGISDDSSGEQVEDNVVAQLERLDEKKQHEVITDVEDRLKTAKKWHKRRF